MNQIDRELYDQIIERDRSQLKPVPPREPAPAPTIHYTELPEVTSGGPISREWNFYRREVGRLLAEGHEGRWVLIKGEEIVGIWGTKEEARAEALCRYQLQPVLIHQVLEREPLLRTSYRLFRCRP
jgi:hypothetical protein